MPLTVRHVAIAVLLAAGPAATAAAGPGADVVVSHKGPRAVLAGELVPLTVRITNRGGQVARGVVLEQRIPDRLSLARARAGVRVRGRTITWRPGDLRPGRSRTIRYALRPDPGARGVRCPTVGVRAANASGRWAAACFFLTLRRRPPGPPPPVTG